MTVTNISSFGRVKLGLAAIGLLAVGGVAGVVVGHHALPPIAMAPLHPVAIRDLASSQGIVAVKGRVAERFGGRLVIDDGTGRTLIDAGPRFEDSSTAALGAAVTVQGRYDRGGFRPDYLVDASGTVSPLGPPPGPHHGPHGGPGPNDGHGPDAGPESPPAPPPPVQGVNATR